MRQSKYHILCTRPLALSLVEKAQEEDIDIEVKAFISIRPVPPGILKKEIERTVIPPDAAIVFTSGNAVEIIARYLQDNITPSPLAWNIYCIGGHTLEKVKEYFPALKIKGTAWDGSGLADKITANEETGPVIFFCGNKRRNGLPGKLRQHGVDIQEITVYENLPSPQSADGRYDGILFFSPSAVDSFLGSNRIPENVPCFCAGNTTGSYLAEKVSNKIVIAAKPEEKCVVETLITYFKQ